MSMAYEFLKTCATLERQAGLLYQALSDSMEHDLSTSKLFGALAKEEENHAVSVEMLLRLLPKMKEHVEINPAHLESARKMRSGLKSALEMIELGKVLPVKDALLLAIKIESSGVESLSALPFRNASEDFKSTFDMLEIADATHKKRLEDRLAELESA